MGDSFDLLLTGGTICDADGATDADLGVKDGKISEVGDLSRRAAKRVLNLRGLHILPGVMDTQVHFREPGDNSAENLESGSLSALMGGVTGVFEMPNTAPPTTSPERLREKLRLARGRMWCDYAFYAGAAEDNIHELAEMEKMEGCCGVKFFMGSSTGSLLVKDDETIARALQAITRPAAFHAEDEPRLIERLDYRERGQVASHVVWRDARTALRATERLLRIAKKTGRKVHVLHVSTAEEMALLARSKDIASVETTPQHLTLAAPECYERLGAYAQMNPPIRSARHREALWRALADGVVDVIGSDHAPHSHEAKRRDYPDTPSGMPGAQTLTPIMLHHVNGGRLTLQRFVELTSANAARLFGMRGKGRVAVGYDADLTIVDMSARREIRDDWIASQCGWTPFDGMRVTGWPVGAIIGGAVALWEEALASETPRGKPIAFTPTSRKIVSS